MHSTTYLLICVIPVINLYHLCLAAPVFMCYYPSEARLRSNTAKFEIKDINFALCTHYIYQNAKIDSVTHKLVASDPPADEGPNGLYRQFTNAKILFPSIKTLLSVGGNTVYSNQQCLAVGGDTKFASVFATSAVDFLRQYEFDGLDVYCPSGSDDGKNALSNILKALREKFDEAISNGRLVLTAFAPGVEAFIRNGYDVAALARTVDYVIIATHQLYYDQMRFAHFPTPLYPKDSRDPFFTLAVNVSLSAWNSLGMPYKKMVVGFTGVGRMFELEDKSKYQPWASVKLTNVHGNDYNIKNGLAYPETCRFSQQASKYYDDIQKSPFMVKDSSWVGYDDHDSLQLKIEWVSKYGVAGIMFASLDVDDFTGVFCGRGKFPLLVAMNNAPKKYPPDVETTEKNSTMDTPPGNETTVSSSTTTDGGATDTNTKDDIRSNPVLKATTEEDSNIISNLLYGFLIVLIPIVCLTMALLFGRRRRHQGE